MRFDWTLLGVLTLAAVCAIAAFVTRWRAEYNLKILSQLVTVVLGQLHGKDAQINQLFASNMEYARLLNDERNRPSQAAAPAVPRMPAEVAALAQSAPVVPIASFEVKPS